MILTRKGETISMRRRDDCDKDRQRGIDEVKRRGEKNYDKEKEKMIMSRRSTVIFKIQSD